jgi:glycerate kinase
MRHVVAAPDKFRGTATAAEVAAAVSAAATGAGWTCDEAPVADGGEGLLDALASLGGSVRSATVHGPLGARVEAAWRYAGSTAIIEMARASGLLLAGGSSGNDPMSASTTGTGELIDAAVRAGARRVIIGVGGSATTDGGQGALLALEPHGRLAGVELIVACDVTTKFVDAAEEFAPQKGATPAQVALLRRRLERLAGDYAAAAGVDIAAMPGSGAAGGLAGGLASIGAKLVPGFDLVADLINLDQRIEDADLVVTGEGLLDEWSFNGKAVGGVVQLAADAGVPCLVIAGDVAREPRGGVTEAFAALRPPPVALVERFGRDRAMQDPAACVLEVVASELGRRDGGRDGGRAGEPL